jgi:hypothetical protein
MTPTRPQPAAEFRTPEQVRADEEIAAGFEVFLVKDAAGRVVHQATDERRRLAEAGAADPNNAIAAGGLNVPFLWNGGVFRVTRAGHHGGRTVVAVEPPDAGFEAEVRRRIDAAPCRVLTFYQGFGFVCFPEDHDKYQG